MKIEFITDKRTDLWGWHRDAKVGDRTFALSVKRGKRVKIPFKPRGKNIGYRWHATVYERGGGCIWSGDVPGSIGCRGLLIKAGIIAKE